MGDDDGTTAFGAAPFLVFLQEPFLSFPLADFLEILTQIHSQTRTDLGELGVLLAGVILAALVAEDELFGVQTPQNLAIRPPFFLMRPSGDTQRLTTVASHFFWSAIMFFGQCFSELFRILACPMDLAGPTVKTASADEIIVHHFLFRNISQGSFRNGHSMPTRVLMY
jgi:hypothetical protein